MQIRIRRGSAACLLGLVLSSVSIGAVKNNVIAPEARTLAGGRDVYIMIPQAEIKPNINISNITAAAGGGLLFALIDAGVNNSRAKDAEKTVVPLREALVGFEFDPRAQLESVNTLSGLGWFEPKETKISKDDSQKSMLAAVDQAGTQQNMFLRYSYETNADFSGLVVSLGASLANKQVPKGKKPDARLQAKNLAYNSSVRSMIMLPDANPKDPAANVQAWSADGGKAARAALLLGIERCQKLLARGMSLTPADAESLRKRNKRKMSAVPGVAGWVIDSPPESTIVYDPLFGQVTQVETFNVVTATAAVAPTAAPVAAPTASAVPVTAPAPSVTATTPAR